MKRITIILGILLSAVILNAQNEVDALRYSTYYHGGTARFISMGGAFNALGGDPSTLTFNPAGIGIYRKSEFTFTPTFYLNDTRSTYLGSSYTDHKYNFNFNNFAIIGASLSGNEDGWAAVNFGFAYNRLNNFHRYSIIEGQNFTSSITDYFAEIADGNSVDNLNYFNEGLAWETYLIDPDSSGNTADYMSSLIGRGEYQTRYTTQKGYIGEYAFSIGANYANQFYIGGTIGIQSLRYEEDVIYSEDDRDSLINDFNFLEYKQHLETHGTGVNFKLGVIYRPVDWVRIGGAIHTPTFFGLNDLYSSSMRSSINSVLTDTSISYKGTWYDSPSGEYNYSLTTPFKAIGSLAFVIKKAAIVSVDYEFVDYSIARLRADDYSFITENNSISNSYTYAGNIRAGLEYKYGPFSFRGGYALYQSPYNKSQVDNDGSLTIYSGGIGIRSKSFYIDLAYTYSVMNENFYLYSPNVVTVEPAKMETTASRIIATLGFNF